MKFIISLSLNLLLLLVFTTAPISYVWACSGKDKCKKETTEHASKSKCEKDCCKKSCSDSKNKKKGCCGGDCSCSVSTLIMADLPKRLSIDKVLLRPVFIVKNDFFFKQIFPKSTFQDIWQPPRAFLSIG
ncbi:MAG: hypothetical protein JNL70_28055 [Saprospiraceae bacterium]|nr:hypothetical protein [Saprospiraceae bacterium]